MKAVSVETALANIERYFSNNVFTPFIVVVDGGTEYLLITNSLGALGRIRTSNYCRGEDVYPDIDELFDTLLAATEKTLLLGVGETASLSGNEQILSRLKDLPLTTKIVVLCRNARAAIRRLCAEDKKLDSRRVCFVKSEAPCEVVQVPDILTLPAVVEDNFQTLLSHLEDGFGGTVLVKTSLALHNVRQVRSAYEAIRLTDPGFLAPRTCLPDDFWAQFLIDRNLEGYDLFHWRSYLKLKLESSTNAYLEYVVDSSPNYAIYKKRVFSALLDFDTTDIRFPEMYSARKELLKSIKDSEIAEYIAETRVRENDRIWYLTDNTAAERQAIIESLEGLEVVPRGMENVYPALADYLQTYFFTGDQGELLTAYFDEYKRLKVTNRLTQEFRERVRELAADGNRPYTSLMTRGEVLDRLPKANAALYWIDALGVEYLSYIQTRAKALGLNIRIHVVRANLPSITSFNSDFYEAWSGDKAQTKELDRIKHDGEQDFNYQTVKTPIHLAEELRIIDGALDWAKVKLSGRNADKVILVSDHGASRLAVINEQECKWEMLSKGKHSGRCCPCRDADVKYEYATRENDFWVLADYDRFKGGRKASVEVHGGATLEEVVIPVIEIELVENKVEVTNTTPITAASYKKKAEIVIFSKTALKDVSVRVLGRRYDAEEIGSHRHKITFPDIRRAGKYTADIFAGDNLVGQVEFEVRPESGRTRDDWF